MLVMLYYLIVMFNQFVQRLSITWPAIHVYDTMVRNVGKALLCWQSDWQLPLHSSCIQCLLVVVATASNVT